MKIFLALLHGFDITVKISKKHSYSCPIFKICYLLILKNMVTYNSDHLRGMKKRCLGCKPKSAVLGGYFTRCCAYEYIKEFFYEMEGSIQIS